MKLLLIVLAVIAVAVYSVLDADGKRSMLMAGLQLWRVGRIGLFVILAAYLLLRR